MTRVRPALCLLAVLLAVAHPAAQKPPDIVLNTAAVRDVVDGVLTAVNRYYLSAEVAARVDADLRGRLTRGEYDRITSAYTLMDTLDAQLEQASRDPHLKVAYSAEASPSSRAPSIASRQPRSAKRHAVPRARRISVSRRSSGCRATSACSSSTASRTPSSPGKRLAP